MQELNLTAEERQLREDIVGKIERYFGRNLDEATPKMIYKACTLRIRDEIMKKWSQSHQIVKNEGSKKLYYLSFEFLLGRSFATNVLNLLQTNQYKNVLTSLGVDIDDIIEHENDAGLGNGGLGRLAACFLDSLTTLDLPAYGSTIRYEYGLFRQKIVDGYQFELPDTWLDSGSYVWEISKNEEAVEVKFGGKVHQEWIDGKCKFHYENSHTIIAIPYDVPICGFDSKIINKLRLWSAKSPDTMNMAEFNKGNYIRAVEEKHLAEVISSILYPEDNHETGKELRLKQQYFLVSATMQWIMAEFRARYGKNWSLLPEKVVIHINDTHPTMAIPEMMRILMDEEELGWDEAWDIVTKVFAYTNHTVMSEALEKWSIPMFERVLPRVYMIIDEINRRLMENLELVYPGDTGKHLYMAILAHNQVHMANLCLATCFAVNGVSKLHTQILVDDIFADYYRLDKKRFHAITNGITFRRWIGTANPALTDLITSKIGKGWLKDASKLEGLKMYAKDPEFQAEFTKIKRANKVVVADYIKKHNGIEIDPDSIFDLQCKRLHEYKRQLMNILHIMSLYDKLLQHPNMEFNKTTFIFGAKAAPGYARAKLIIKLINTVADIINNDPRINDKIKVVFIENYGVSIAEKLVAAADISEQISTAGKEASGTGNMKFMLNGAVTVGTLDGANVEMLEQVGSDYIYIFGLKANEVSDKLRENGAGDVLDIINSDYSLKNVLNQLKDGSLSPENPTLFKDLYDTLVNGDYGYPDVYMVIRDFEAYSKIHEVINRDYSNKSLWAEKTIMNTASAGFFSSDRTILDYNNNIWHLQSI